MSVPTLSELASLIGGSVVGESAIRIERPCPPDDARGAGDLAVAVHPKQRQRLPDSAARAAVLTDSEGWEALGVDGAIIVSHPRMALVGITKEFASDPRGRSGVHPSAVVDPRAHIADRVFIGPLSVIDEGATIEEGVCILGSVTVGANSRVGAESLLYPGVRIGWGVSIGRRAILHSNVCIGSDGFSFLEPDANRIALAKKEGRLGQEAGGGKLLRIHSLSGVRLGDDVEIGACSAIDRGTLSHTHIGDGVKIDNLVHIAHNVHVGPNSMLCGQVGIAGSARIGEGCILGGQVGVGDHASVGEYCLIGGKSLISGHVRPRSIRSGWASLDRQEFHSVFRAVRRLARGVRETDAP